MPSKLRSRLTFANVVKRRSAVILALATALVVATAGVAQANNSTLSLRYCKFASSCLTNPGAAFTPGSLRVHWTTTYSPPANRTPPIKTNRVRLYFDNNIAFNVSAAPKCNPVPISGNITMAQAMAACGSALIGQGSAAANVTFNAGDAKGCVLVFNRNPEGLMLFVRFQVPGAISCANPATNNGGNATVLLQAPFANNPGATAPGGALNAAHYAPGAFPSPRGRFLDFNNIGAAFPLPLRDVNFRIYKGNYVRARCTARAGLGVPAKKWVMRGVFNYINGGTPASQAVNAKQPPGNVPACA